MNYCEQVKEVPESIQLKSNKEILMYQFETLMSDVEIDFNVFDDPILNDELKERFLRIFLFKYYDQQVGGSSSPEYRFKINFERIFLENIDRFNGLLRVQLKSLKEIEKDLMNNYDLKTVYKENTTGDEKTNTTTNDTNVKTTDQTDTQKRDTSNNDQTDKTTDNQTEDFNRELFEETPNSQLELTTEDGKGVITTATTISENFEKGKVTGVEKDVVTKKENQTTDNTSNQTTDQTKTGVRDLDRKTGEEKDSTRYITGYQNLGSKPKILNEYSQMYSNTLSKFVMCFDKLFRYVY